MMDKTLVSAVQKVIEKLDYEREDVNRDFQIAVDFLAMVKRRSVSLQTGKHYRNQAEEVGDMVLDILSQCPHMHRSEIVNILNREGIHLANSTEDQLSRLSSILSKDGRFKPFGERTGEWQLVSMNGTDSAPIGATAIEPGEWE